MNYKPEEHMIEIADYILSELEYKSLGAWEKRENGLATYYEKSINKGCCQLNNYFPRAGNERYCSLWIVFERKTAYYDIDCNLSKEDNFILGFIKRL